jgi:hypothetical protein
VLDHPLLLGVEHRRWHASITAEGGDTIGWVAERSTFYLRLDESGRGGQSLVGRYRATPHTAGPWDRRLQHAGPPTALLVRAVERLDPGPALPLLARVTAEIMAPVPVADLTVSARVERAGRRVAWCTATLAAADDPDVVLMRLAAWVLRRTDEPLTVPHTAVEPAPSAGTPMARPDGWGPGYLDAVQWRFVAGEFGRPGPSTVWTRLAVDLVDGEPPSPTQRVAAVADSGSGISAVADPRALLFVNTDLSVHLVRAPAGEDVWMHAETTIDPHGVGLARTTLGDQHGSLGAAAQTLFVAPR